MILVRTDSSILFVERSFVKASALEALDRLGKGLERKRIDGYELESHDDIIERVNFHGSDYALVSRTFSFVPVG